MEQDLNQNFKQFQEVLKSKLSDKVRKGIQGKIEQVNNSVNLMTQQTNSKTISDEQMKQLMNNLNLISKNLLEIFQKEMISDDPKNNQTFLEKLDGFQIACEHFQGYERNPFVTKHNDVLVDLNQEANQFLQNKINQPLNEKVGENFLNIYHRNNKLYNSSIDNLLEGIKKKTDLRSIIQQRMSLEENFQTQIDQQLMQDEGQEQNVEYIQNDENDNVVLQDEYQEDVMDINQNDDNYQMQQNDNEQIDDYDEPI